MLNWLHFHFLECPLFILRKRGNRSTSFALLILFIILYTFMPPCSSFHQTKLLIISNSVQRNFSLFIFIMLS